MPSIFFMNVKVNVFENETFERECVDFEKGCSKHCFRMDGIICARVLSDCVLALEKITS